MCVYLCEYLLIITSLNKKKDKGTKFYVHYQTDIHMNIPRFCEIRKTESRLYKIGSKYLKSGCNDFLQIRYTNSNSGVFSNVLVVYYRKIEKSPD